MSPAKAGQTGERSLMATARWAAALSILSGVPDGFALSTLRKLIVRGDAAATAANILGSEGLYRFALVADLAGILLFVASGVLLYEIFRAVSRRSALFFLVLISMGAVIQALDALQGLTALLLIKGGAGAGLSALPAAPANALALVFLRLYSHSFQLGLVFGGCSSVVIGSLVLRSTFLPRIIGPLMMIDGLGYLTFSLASFLAPPFALHIYPYVAFTTALLGEGALFFWLIVKGVNAERWQEQAAATERAAPA